MTDKKKQPVIPADHTITYKELESALSVTRGFILTEIGKKYPDYASLKKRDVAFAKSFDERYMLTSKMSIYYRNIHKRLDGIDGKHVIFQRTLGIVIGFSLALFIFFCIEAWNVWQIMGVLGGVR